MELVDIVKFVHLGNLKLFREIWFDGTRITIHQGIVGQKGKISHHLADSSTAKAIVSSFRAQANRDNFVELVPSMTTEVVILFNVDGFGTIEQLQTRHAIEEEIDQALGWTGNGQCTGGNSGGDDMQIFCQTVSAEEAIPVIENVLNKHRHLFGHIRIEGDSTKHL